MKRFQTTIALALAALTACSKSPTPVHPFLAEPFPANLSAWRLFLGRAPHLQPNARVVPYDLNTPLFSDYASKYRFVWMPPYTSATYREDTVFDFPVGTILIKTFAFPTEADPGKERLIETRLLVHTQSGWIGLPYIWNAAQTEAHLDLVPDPVPIRYTDAAGTKRDFTYFIPNANECKQCHENNHATLPIGPKARNLNKDFAYPDATTNQLAYWTKIGYLQGAPSPDRAPKVPKWNDDNSGTLDARARAYLDNNCAHCHQPGGTAGYTGIDFRVTTDSMRGQHMWGQPPPPALSEVEGAVPRAQPASGAPSLAHSAKGGKTTGNPSFTSSAKAGSSAKAEERTNLHPFGLCKSPNSSGRVGTLTYDLVPGQPDASILLARMQSIRPKEMMPQIGRSIVHAEGVALIRAWIQSLPADDAACSKTR